MRKYCVILIINHSLLKNDIFKNQDQFANDSLAVERTKFMACVIWSECFDQFSKYQKLLPIGYRWRRKSKSPVFHITCFFQLNTDIKSLSYRDLSLALYYIQWIAHPTESGDKILIHLTPCQRIDFYWHTGEHLIIYPSAWESISKGFI